MAKEGKLDPILKSYLFAADRYIRMKQFNEDDFKEKTIIFDRYVPSALAYRMAEGISKDWISVINMVFPKPDLGFFIDITPEESIARNSSHKFNIKYTPEHLKKVREAYLTILKENNLIYIDGMQSIENIFNIVIKNMEEYEKNYRKRI